MMDSVRKIELLIYTVIVALATAWWLIPAFFDIWLETATCSGTYELGLVFGIVLGVCWSALVWYWVKS